MSTLPSKQTRKYNSRLRALLTKVQPGKDLTLLEKVLKIAENDLNSFDIEEKKLAISTIIKFMPYVLIKPTLPTTVINNNTLNNRIGGPEVAQKLVDFMEEREKKIAALEEREVQRQLKTLEGSKKVKEKLPANTPINQ